MIFEKFIEQTKGWWSAYFDEIAAYQRKGLISSDGRIMLYPNMLLVTKMDNYYVAELVGANVDYQGLVAKRHSERSIYRYFSQFDGRVPDPLGTVGGEGTIFQYLCLAHEVDQVETLKRFPQLELYASRLVRIGGYGSLFDFRPDFISAAISNCILINTSGNLVRCKSILTAFVVSERINWAQLVRIFEKLTSGGVVAGVHAVLPEREHRLVIAGQLQSLYLAPNLRETTIGEFIHLHPQVVREAFHTDEFLYEPSFEWREHDGTCTDESINPDLLVKRPDGGYDIYDLKTALLSRLSATKGGRRRRRFIDGINEGIAQLANYREYFEYKSNAEHAMEKYGISVVNPRLVLVVGSWENVDAQEVAQALRGVSDSVEIVDYDTLCQMFIGKPVEGADIPPNIISRAEGVTPKAAPAPASPP